MVSWEKLGFVGWRPIGWLVALLLGGMLVTACGSDDVTREDYRTATGEVCAKYEQAIEVDRRKISQLAARSGDDPEQFVEVVRQFERDWDEFAAALKAVERPPADRVELDRFFTSLTKSQEEMAQLSKVVGELPELVREVRQVQKSQDAEAARELVADAERIERDIEKTEAGFDRAVTRFERFVNTYPGLANCR